jgi:hypothetical protein
VTFLRFSHSWCNLYTRFSAILYIKVQGFHPFLFRLIIVNVYASNRTTALLLVLQKLSQHLT